MSIKERLKAHRYETANDGKPITALDHLCAPSNQSRSGINSAKKGFLVLIFLAFFTIAVLALALIEKLTE